MSLLVRVFRRLALADERAFVLRRTYIWAKATIHWRLSRENVTVSLSVVVARPHGRSNVVVSVPLCGKGIASSLWQVERTVC
jgi:hypothetical protein